MWTRMDCWRCGCVAGRAVCAALPGEGAGAGGAQAADAAGPRPGRACTTRRGERAAAAAGVQVLAAAGAGESTFSTRSLVANHSPTYKHRETVLTLLTAAGAGESTFNTRGLVANHSSYKQTQGNCINVDISTKVTHSSWSGWVHF